MLCGVLMIGALFLLVRTATGRPAPAAVAVCAGRAGRECRGRLRDRHAAGTGRPLAALLDTNIDAITAWRFGGLRIDNVPRSLWYTPQHTTRSRSASADCSSRRSPARERTLAAIAGAGLALGLATTLNPLLGVVCAAHVRRLRLGGCAAPAARMALVPRHAVAAVPVVLAVGWGAASRVMEGAGSALDVGFSGFSRN